MVDRKYLLCRDVVRLVPQNNFDALHFTLKKEKEKESVYCVALYRLIARQSLRKAALK